MYIEPCCCDRQIPKLLREQSTAFFQTNGDVTVQKFMNAATGMVNNQNDMWLMLPSVNLPLLRSLRHHLSMGFSKTIHLLTQDNQESLVMSELASSVPSGSSAGSPSPSVPSGSPAAVPAAVPAASASGVIFYAHDPMIIDGLLAFIGEKDAIAIQGAMLPKVDFSLSLYVGVFGPRQKFFDTPNGKIRTMLEPMISKMKIKGLKPCDTPSSRQNSGSP